MEIRQKSFISNSVHTKHHCYQQRPFKVKDNSYWCIVDNYEQVMHGIEGILSAETMIGCMDINTMKLVLFIFTKICM